MGEVDAILNRVLKSQENYTMQIVWDVSGNPIYVGEAEPGTSTSDTGWRIKKITWTSGNPTQITWASGSREFKFTWDKYLNYTYS